jgi:DNA-binding CsgD family transcriptional regulator
VRERLGQRASLEAPARARAAAEAAHREGRVAPRRGGEPVRARTEKQLAYERRRRQERTRKQKRAAKLLAQGMTQQAVAAELGVTTRTLRSALSSFSSRTQLDATRVDSSACADVSKRLIRLSARLETVGLARRLEARLQADGLASGPSGVYQLGVGPQVRVTQNVLSLFRQKTTSRAQRRSLRKSVMAAAKP